MTELSRYQLTQLQTLEAEAIHIIREVAAEFERPVLLFSGGKDSIVMLHLAVKAFHPAKPPFAVMHIDTGQNFDEVLAFRDRRVRHAPSEKIHCVHCRSTSAIVAFVNDDAARIDQRRHSGAGE